MKDKRALLLLMALSSVVLLLSFAYKKRIVKVYLIGDSTVADYSLEKDFETKRYPVTGWGQVFQPFLKAGNLKKLNFIIKGDSALVDDRAKGGRSTRTFFEEGRWAAVYQSLQKDDLVRMQFGHNDGAVDKPERYVNIPGYKEYLRLFVDQTREKGAIPVLLTPVARNYPWKDGKLSNVHGEYPEAVKTVADEKHALFLSGRTKDNTHFQPEGATAVAGLVYEAMTQLNNSTNKK
ncbi:MULTISPECIES: rhamnogalacturonan acetylesterase [Niastella]|uniref:Rhamnogalacturonan acetylesterase n=1 Tax=Niastella soli TaxID=2821487 RepID=A0ABS3YRJ5_9BACT|nr:rhamnogalacturonan acetylesterase [Niastella soli]MBO9200549.1 rhamnogalacturonan acetylesterase [Niastella soli]